MKEQLFTFEFRKTGSTLRGDKGVIKKRFKSLGDALQYAHKNDLGLIRQY